MAKKDNIKKVRFTYYTKNFSNFNFFILQPPEKFYGINYSSNPMI